MWGDYFFTDALEQALRVMPEIGRKQVVQ
jgi:hypothetical protein